MLSVRFTRAATLAVLALLLAAPASAQRLLPRGVSSHGITTGDRPAGVLTLEASAEAAAPPAWTSVLDPSARALALGSTPPGDGVSLSRGADGRTYVDLFVQTSSVGQAVAMRGVPGVEVRTVVGDIAVVRVPVAGLEALARTPGVTFVEASQIREAHNATGRADMRADVVQAGGGGLPRAFRGAGVVVGVVDSGIDVTHPDFFNAGGSRIRFLLEFLDGGGQREFTKAQIDANPAAIPERDGTGGGGHGSHVTGSAAGSGTVLAEERGIAPEADIVFVKGVRNADSNGGFADADYVAGVDFIFQRAAQLGRPAVVNLSLGGHFGSPHDGTSLSEQALSGLTGPGKIVVASAGNDGSKFLHAGRAFQSGQNETIWFANPSSSNVTMWYTAGSLTQFGIAAYSVSNGALQFLGFVSVNAGQILGSASQSGVVPFMVGGTKIADVRIDAATTQDPRNGAGHVQFYLVGGNGIDLSQVVFSVATAGTAPGRLDMWVSSGQFYNQVYGFSNVTEMPGNNEVSVGSPSTALGVLAVGSHVTNTRWTDIDGTPRTWMNPNPNGDPNAPMVVPPVGQQSYFSSHGPTRDGRVSPDISGPGENIISVFSSQVQVGGQGGVERARVVQGGRYRTIEGTSMSSPHVAGTVALMLQANPRLTAADVRQILQTTARTDGFTGAVPNNNFGGGKADALAAVLRTLQLCGSSCGGGGTTGTVLAEIEPNNSLAQAQPLGGAGPVRLNGQASNTDVGAFVVQFTDGGRDDIEDLFRITTTAPGLALALGGYSQDLDLYLIDAAGQIVAASNTVNPTETIGQPALPAGTYTVGVSFYDAGTEAGQTPYALTATGTFAVADEDAADAAGLVLMPAWPNPVRASAQIAFEMPAASDARVAVFDMLGREVVRLADGPHAAGAHHVTLDAHALSSGLYVVRLTTPAGVRTQTVAVAR